MTEQTAHEDVDATVGGDQQDVSVEELKALNAKLEAEAAKHRNIRKKVEQERDEYKQKVKTSQDEDYKSLWQQEVEEKNKLMATVKGSAVNSALTAQLTKAGVLPDAIEAAIGLVDQQMIEWDRDSGVDSASVTAAVAKLKAKHAFMFEKKVARTEPKSPADGSSTDANEMKRSDFEKLNPIERFERIKKGLKVVD